MGRRYQEEFKVRGRDVDRYGNMHLSTLASILLQVSGQQTENLNAEYGDPMANKNLTWFILQHDMIIYRMPKFNDILLIETQALAYNRFFTHRAFKVWCNDELIVETMMRFAIVDSVERKLVRIVPELVERYAVEEKTKLDAMEKIVKIDEISSRISTYQSYFSDIDINQHVNNAVYLNWVVNSLDEDFVQHHIPKKVTISYENEVRLGEHVTHHLHIVDDKTVHYLMNGEKSVAKAQIIWDTK